MTASDELREALSAHADEQRMTRRFTFHVDFVAADVGQARGQAEVYAHGLNQLRPEVDSYTARVSLDGDWLSATMVFCGAPGPDPTDVCTDSTGHSGLHNGPGISRQWSDDVPGIPDSMEDAAVLPPPQPATAKSGVPGKEIGQAAT